jgi:hypothetical protein
MYKGFVEERSGSLRLGDGNLAVIFDCRIAELGRSDWCRGRCIGDSRCSGLAGLEHTGGGIGSFVDITSSKDISQLGASGLYENVCRSLETEEHLWTRSQNGTMDECRL